MKKYRIIKRVHTLKDNTIISTLYKIQKRKWLFLWEDIEFFYLDKTNYDDMFQYNDFRSVYDYDYKPSIWISNYPYLNKILLLFHCKDYVLFDNGIYPAITKDGNIIFEYKNNFFKSYKKCVDFIVNEYNKTPNGYTDKIVKYE